MPWQFDHCANLSQLLMFQSPTQADIMSVVMLLHEERNTPARLSDVSFFCSLQQPVAFDPVESHYVSGQCLMLLSSEYL